MTEAEDVVFESNDIPAHWAYVAYGHIHKAQRALAGADHVRYSGSVEKLDFGEANDEKSVVLLEMGEKHLLGKPQKLPLDATPIYRIEITDPVAQIAHLREQYPDAERALVNYTLHWQAGVHDRDALRQEVESIFPRWYGRKLLQMSSEAGPGMDYTNQRIDDVGKNVRDYLKSRLGQVDGWEEIMTLTEELLAQDTPDEEVEE
jgi:exonuclease SbcD